MIVLSTIEIKINGLDRYLDQYLPIPSYAELCGDS
jgi:hypothetical protein